MKRKQLLSILTGTALVLSLAACGTDASTATSLPTSEATEAVTETAASVTDAQTAFTFTDSGITVEGSSDGYECSGTALTIDTAGTYLLSGSCADGSVIIKKGTTGVRLILSGLSLTSADTAPITCNKSSEVVIVAADGTENVLTDAAANNDESNSGNENAENAVIKCKDGSAVTLCGSGTLTLNAYGKNGIKSGATTAEEGEASLTIRELTLNINASVNDAINAEQYLAVESGTLNLAAADDALHCDLIMDIGAEGTDGPMIDITEACEGIEAAALSIRSGDISIVCTDDCLNAANSDLGNYDFAINISGGTIVAYTTAGDGFDSNCSLTISGGNVTVWSGGTADNQPLDADGTITITGGTVLAAGGSAGMGMNLSTTQAYVTFGSTGMGNMGGQPGSLGGMQPPQNGGQPGSDSQANGNFQPSDDFRPGDAPSGNSMPSGDAQPGGFGASLVSAGSTLTILDSSGSTVCSGEAPCSAAFVFFSSADLNTDETYTLSADGISAATATAQAGTSTAQNGGQPGQMPGSGSQPGQPGEGQQPGQPGDGQQPGGDPPAMPGSDNSSGNAI